MARTISRGNKKLKYALIALALVSASANAVTVTSTPGFNPVPNHQVFQAFEQNNLQGWSLFNAGVRKGTTANWAAPLGNDTFYLSVQANGRATYNHGGSFTTLSFDWGSIDTYNSINFFNGANLVASFSGSNIVNPANGNQSSVMQNRTVLFNFTGGPLPTSFSMSSSSNAFEADNFAMGVIPEPATWAMLIAGFGLVGLSVRRRNRYATA